MQIQTIDEKHFRLGESKTSHSSDGGFSPDSYGLNLAYEKGQLNFVGGLTDVGGNILVGKIIAKAKDKSYLGNDQYFLDDEGNFYTLNSSTLAKEQTDSTKTYQIGTTDMLQFQGNLYVTSQNDVTKLSGSGLTAIDATWWSTTEGKGTLDSGVRHPLEIVEDTLYIGDGNNIHAYDGSISTKDAITLPTGVNVISLRKHPDGRHLIAFCGVTANYSHTLGLSGVAYHIDTVTWEFIREIPLESQVEGTINHEGTIMCTWGKNFGYFDGSGLVWMRDLESDTTYSHNLENQEDTLLIRDSNFVIAYGDLGKGKVFWKLYKSGTSIDTIAFLGNGKIAIGYYENSTDYLKYFDISERGNSGQFWSNPINLSGRRWIRRMELIHEKTTTTWIELVLSRKDDVEEQYQIHTISYVSNPGHKRARVDMNLLTDMISVGLRSQATGTLGTRKISIYHESAE